MINEIKGNVLNVDVDAVFHVANCFHTMGGGVALAIKKKYPAAYEADLATVNGGVSKLGTFSKATVTVGGKVVYNLYAQFSFGGTKRLLDYEYLYQSIEQMMIDAEQHCKISEPLYFACPKFLGCGLAGGDWHIVKSILEHFFKDSLMNHLWIVELDSCEE